MALVVQGRRNSASADWDYVAFVDPNEVDAVNATYGWKKYRVAEAPDATGADEVAAAGMTPEGWSADYTRGYHVGLEVGRGGAPFNWAGTSQGFKAGYRRGYAWGRDHPAPTPVLAGIR